MRKESVDGAGSGQQGCAGWGGQPAVMGCGLKRQAVCRARDCGSVRPVEGREGKEGRRG